MPDAITGLRFTRHVAGLCLLLILTAACQAKEPSSMIEQFPALAGAVPTGDAEQARAQALDTGFQAYLRERYTVRARRHLVIQSQPVPWVALRNQMTAYLRDAHQAKPEPLAWHRAGHDLYALWTTGDGRHFGLAMEPATPTPVIGYFELERAGSGADPE